jgi:hypothetical protein
VAERDWRELFTEVFGAPGEFRVGTVAETGLPGTRACVTRRVLIVASRR